MQMSEFIYYTENILFRQKYFSPKILRASLTLCQRRLAFPEHHQNETSMKLFRQENGEEEEGQKAEKKELLNELSSTAKTKELMPS
mgnify:CR=1 FL=1